MSHEHFKKISILSFFILIVGLVLMFSSISLGTALGASWLSGQEGGVADTDQYNLIVGTYINNFVIIGSILFGAGLLSAIFTYCKYVLSLKVRTNI